MVRRFLPLCALAAGVLTAQALWNLRTIRRPQPTTFDLDEDVTVLVPARNEAQRIAGTITSLREQQYVPRMQVRVLDDGSSDNTHDIAAAAANGDPRFTIERASDDLPPDGWLGKNYACHRLAQSATGSILVFVDADVRLEPDAVAALVHELRRGDFDLLAPYPRQLAQSWLERLVQPLLVWSWMSTVPLAIAEATQWQSMSAANGQLLVFDAGAYQRAGGHDAVRGDVLEDIALMRSMRATGGRAATVDGSHLATCRMYESAGDLVDGYAKSAWAAFGGPLGSVVTNGLLVAIYVVPATAVLFGRGGTRAWGLAGYTAGVLGRAAIAGRTGERAWPDALAHPASIIAFTTINAISWSRHLRGTTQWKGRSVQPAGSSG